MAKKADTRYARLIEAIFTSHYRRRKRRFEFRREEIEEHARQLEICLPKNLGDLIYSFRYRTPLPEAITSTAPRGSEWIISPAGKGVYRFELARLNRVVPSENQYVIKIPDATPELVTKYAMSDEQALLAKVRYNRLIDIFLRVTAYSLQNHLRTTAGGIGQMETDELYVAVRNTGEHFIIPVQAKGDRDQIGSIQIAQDMAMCNDRFPQLTCRPVAVQFWNSTDGGEIIVMFEFLMVDGEVKVVDQKHYRLVPGDDISDNDLTLMSRM